MGLTKPRASQIYNLDYKQSTRVVTVADVTLAGGAPNQVDGVNLSLNDRILVTGQTTGSQNGLYYVTTVGSGSNGTWARTSDGNETGEIEAGMIVMVTAGSVYADTQWKLITDDPIIIGSTALVFTQNYSANSISGGTSNVTVYSNANVTISSAGTPNVLIVSSTGTVTSGTASVTGNITGGNINVVGTTAATSKTTGALIVAGGIGVASDVWAGNSITVDGGAYGNVVATQFAGLFATAAGPNPYSIVQVRSNDGTTGMGMQAYTGLNGKIYSNSGITFTTGATIKDKDYPTGGTSRATIDSTGLSVTGITSATGNITGGNVLTGGLVSATGNVAGAYILGNGVSLTGVITSVANINDGTSNVTVVSSGGNVTIGVGGTGNVAVFATTGEYVSGVVSATGNIPGGNIITSGTVYVTSNVSATGNIRGGNINTTGLVTATGNITGGNILTGGILSSTGTVTGSSLLGTVVSASGNVTGGNVRTVGQVSATGNVTTDTFFVGNGYFLTGLTSAVSVTKIENGNSNVWVNTPGGDVTVTAGGVANVAVFSTGSLTLAGAFGTPKTISANVIVASNINAMLIGPLVFADGYNLTVPTSSTVYVYAP